MDRKVRCITRTAGMLALLVALQAVTRSMGQLVTGSFVNGVLAVTALTIGLSGGITVAVLSPVLAYLLGVAPQIITLPAIMAGNTVFVITMYFVAGKYHRQIVAWLCAAVFKFVVLYVFVVWLLCGVLSERLLASGALQAPMLQALPAMFSWPQMVTALVGGGAALLIMPILRKTTHHE